MHAIEQADTKRARLSCDLSRQPPAGNAACATRNAGSPSRQSQIVRRLSTLPHVPM